MFNVGKLWTATRKHPFLDEGRRKLCKSRTMFKDTAVRAITSSRASDITPANSLNTFIFHHKTRSSATSFSHHLCKVAAPPCSPGLLFFSSREHFQRISWNNRGMLSAVVCLRRIVSWEHMNSDVRADTCSPPTLAYFIVIGTPLNDHVQNFLQKLST